MIYIILFRMIKVPTFLGPGTSFVEDNFHTDTGVEGCFGIIQVHYVDYTTTDLAGGGNSGNKASYGKQL